MKQIRCYVDDKSYSELKNEAKRFRISLNQLAGLKLNGFDIVEQGKE